MPARCNRAGGIQEDRIALAAALARKDEANGRGVAFRTPPTDRGFGVFADSMDPDGHEVSIRELPEAESLEEQLAEPFEDDATPRQAAFRKPVKKRATAASRLTLKPVHKGKRTPGARRHPAKAARVVSPRGTGPAGRATAPLTTPTPMEGIAPLGGEAPAIDGGEVSFREERSAAEAPTPRPMSRDERQARSRRMP